MVNLYQTCKTAEKCGKLLWSLACSSSSHIPASIGNTVQIARHPAGMRERRGWVWKNMKKKMRRSWFFLISSTCCPLSSSSMDRRFYLPAPCKFLVRCAQRGCPRLWSVGGGRDGWMGGWTDTSRHTTYPLLPVLLLLQFFYTYMHAPSFITSFSPDRWWESVV